MLVAKSVHCFGTITHPSKTIPSYATDYLYDISRSLSIGLPSLNTLESNYLYDIVGANTDVLLMQLN